MPNAFSYLVLFSWPLVVFVLFRTLPRAQALCWSIIGGYLILPIGVGFNLPVLPTLDKSLIPALTAGILCLAMAEAGLGARRRRQAAASGPVPARVPAPAETTATTAAETAAKSAAQPGFTRARRRSKDATSSPGQASGPGATVTFQLPRPILAMMILLFINVFLTFLTNLDPYRVGTRGIQGLQLYDAFSSLQNEAIQILPYVLGLFVLARPAQNATLLKVLCLAALIYSLPTLYEIRMSPQLNRIIYGYLSQPFLQAMRDGGFRPVVFLQHGLWLAIFNAMAALGAFALWRNARAKGQPAPLALWAGIWLSGVLLLSNSLGALLVLIVLAPVVLFFSLRLQLIVAAVLAGIMLLYPMLRGAGFIPTQAAYEFALGISEERANSLRIRLENEDRLLNRANEQPLSGWGGYGRSRVYDPTTGEDISITDGMWVIIMGVSGWLGYIAKYGLLGLPVILLALRGRLEAEPFVVSGLAILLVANLIDMIANATLTPVTWLVAGVLAGRAGVTETGSLPVQTGSQQRAGPRGGARSGPRLGRGGMT